MFGGALVLMNESNFERRFQGQGSEARDQGSENQLIPDICRLICDIWSRIKRQKGIWWMPWHREAMKDVARCDKPWGVVSKL